MPRQEAHSPQQQKSPAQPSPDKRQEMPQKQSQPQVGLQRAAAVAAGSGAAMPSSTGSGSTIRARMSQTLQRQVGNSRVSRMAAPAIIQAKLAVNTPGDAYEQEADRVAEQVMRSPASTAAGSDRSAGRRGSGLPVGISRKLCPACQQELRRQAATGQPMRSEALCPECRHKLLGGGEQPLQRQPAAGNVPVVSPDVENHIQSSRGGGQPLATSVRQMMEPRFGEDFSGVRVHTGEASAQAARSIEAKAFTTGQDIHFGAGQYQPGTPAGDQLLAHEITHVVQQGGGTENIDRQPDSGVPDAGVPLDAGVQMDINLPLDPQDRPGGRRYSAQAACVIRLGGSTQTRSAGVVEDTDIVQYNTDCRQDTQYQGPDIRPSDTETHQYLTGQLIDPEKLTRLQLLILDYQSRLSSGQLTLDDAQTIDSAIRFAYDALKRAGVNIMEMPPQVTPPAEMAPDGPAIYVAGLPAFAIPPASGAASGPTLTVIEGGAAAGGAEVATGTSVAGGAATSGALATVGVVLLAVAVIAAITITIYFIVTLEDPQVDPTIPEDLDEASDTIEQTLSHARQPRAVTEPLPEIGNLPHQRRTENQRCTNARQRELQDEINDLCGRLPRSCEESDDCVTLRRNWFRNERCARARERIQRECFITTDRGHQIAIEAAREAEQTCRDIYGRKC